nr:hypothetical protein [Acetoanaerobium pronyense]
MKEKEQSKDDFEDSRHQLYSTCDNNKCVSNHEKMDKVGFGLLDPEKHIYTCEYCDSNYAM